MYGRIPGILTLVSVHGETFGEPGRDRLAQIEGSALQTRFAELLEYRGIVFTAFESWKSEGGVKDTQDVIVSISDSQEIIDCLQSFGEDLPNYLKMSWVDLSVGPRRIQFRPSEFQKCERSRIRRPDVQQVDGMWLTARDRKVLGL